MIARSYVIVNSKFDFSLTKYKNRGGGRIVGRPGAPAGRLMPGADGLMPVKGRDAASADSSRRPGKGRKKPGKPKFSGPIGKYQIQR